MTLKEILEKRRAYRVLKKVEITEETIKDIASAAILAPSCFNNQPWKYVFVKSPEVLEKMKSVFNPGNEWCRNASLIIAVLAKKEFDCIIKEREYYLFDIGLATENIILRATELGLVAHPIAGYSEDKVKEILNIPSDFQVICLIIVGKKDENGSLELLNEKQKQFEEKRPERLKEEYVWSLDTFNEKLNTKPIH